MFSRLGGKIYFDSLSLDLVLCVRYQAICILCMCCIFHGGGGGGGRGVTLLYKPYSYVPSKGWRFCAVLVRKTGINFAHFGLESAGMVCERTTVLYQRVSRFNYK